ncbi:MAG: YwbE family protein [Anaerolineales bacterium]|nr:YwbE family protein [Anaerolineales bacterium]
MHLPKRSEIRPGDRVRIIEKHNQKSGILTAGVVARILTNSPTHPHGIKVMLADGRVGRVQSVEPPAADEPVSGAGLHQGG